MTDEKIRQITNNFWWFMVGVGTTSIIIGYFFM